MLAAQGSNARAYARGWWCQRVVQGERAFSLAARDCRHATASLTHHPALPHASTPAEVSLLALTPGNISDNRVLTTPLGRLCIAVCWDGFHTEVTSHLDGQGCELLAQPSYNDGQWPVYESTPGLWQPLDWTRAPMGGLQAGVTANITT